MGSRVYRILIFLILSFSCTQVFAQGRQALTANAIFYVSTQGNDSNDCTASDSSHACRTIPHVLGVLYQMDLGRYNVIVQVADGIYTEPMGIGSPFLSSGGTVTLQGNLSNPANCLIHTTSADAITVGNTFNLNQKRK